MHLQPAWLRVGMTLVGGVALGLLILRVLVGRDHGFITTQPALFQAAVALHQTAKP